MYNEKDTIAAIATASGEAGIAIVRMSGPDSIDIAESFVETDGKKPSEATSPAFMHGLFRIKGEKIDEVLLLIMRQPKSYTREDVVEIQCHGGDIVSRRILRALLSAGARPAEPGEFTMRAFINGRMDLVQAEAVADLIHAQTNRAASAAIEQLTGTLSRTMELAYSLLIELAAKIEISLDFSEEDVSVVDPSELERDLGLIKNQIERLISTYDEGRLLRHGSRVVISGRPNVGKSTLLNRLLNSERAIVSHLPGTTRDTIEEHISIDGFPVVLTDTAGLRNAECSIEEEGIRRTMEKIYSADLHIYIVDSALGISEEDIEYLQKHDHENTILVRNKIDLINSKPIAYANLQIIDASLVNEVGLAEIRDAIRNKIESGIDIAPSPHATISERHHYILCSVSKNINSSIVMVEGQTPGWETLVASNLREAAENIGALLGRTYHSDLLDNIFGMFCIGK